MKYSFLVYTLLTAAIVPIVSSTAIAEEAPLRSGISISANASATVHINNQLLGTTPYQAALEPGEYIVRLSADGFEPFVRRITVSNNRISELDAQLLEGGGTVEFQASPAGAQLLLDGSKDRYVLPIRFDELEKGKHSWRIIAKGHDPIDGSFSLGEGQNIFIYRELESSAGKALFTTYPEGATVFLDGENIGLTPLELTDLDPAAHSISLQKKGYSKVFRSVDTSMGTRGDVKASLNKIGSSVLIKTKVKDAQVFIENTPINSGRTVRVGKMEKGAYSVRIVAEGYKTLQSDITVPASGRIKYIASLTKEDASGVPTLTQARTADADINWTLWGSIGAGAVLSGTASYFIGQALQPEPAPTGDTTIILP